MTLSLKRSLLCLSAIAVGACSFAENVYVNFTNSDNNLQNAWNSYNGAAAQDLTAAELTQVKSGVVSYLQGIYSGFNLNFTTSNPGGNFATLSYNLTSGAGSYGLADAIDWKNADKNDLGRVYAGNFGDFLLSGQSRAQNLQYLITSLGNVSAHELGHNLGLQHYDSFGYATNTINGGYDVGSGHVFGTMNTFNGGSTVATKRQQSQLSELSKIKLEFADGVGTGGRQITEAAGNNNSIANAEYVYGTFLPVSGRVGLNIEGNISSNDIDYFKFDALAGDRITANIFSDYTENDDVDTVIQLLDGNGTLLFENDDFGYNTTTLTNGGYTRDSLLLNYEVATSGTYYVSVRGFNSSATGDYDLLLTGAVPEPATMIALGAGLVALASRRRRKA